jgi:hypothetical protein
MEAPRTAPSPRQTYDTSASSVPGFSFLLPPVRSQIGQGVLTRISALYFAAEKFWLWRDRLALSANQHVRSVKGRLQHAYHWILSSWPNSNLIEFLHHRRHQGIVVGLLVMAVFIGAMDVAMKASVATSNKSQIASSGAPKLQHRLSTALVTPRPLWTANPSQFKPAAYLTKAEVFNVSNGHPTGGFVVASNAPTEPIAQSRTEPHRTPILQSEAAV